jgi:BlaI family transcriptional regulator, penicillinase repressor
MLVVFLTGQGMPAGRRRDGELTPLELRIMSVLWESGPANVQTVQQRLSSAPPLAYTTVQTMLNVLHRKRRVRRLLRGRAYEYAPLVKRDRAVRHALSEMIDRLFGGSVDGLLMSLVDARKLDSNMLARLRRVIEEHEAGTKEKQDGDR